MFLKWKVEVVDWNSPQLFTWPRTVTFIQFSLCPLLQWADQPSLLYCLESSLVNTAEEKCVFRKRMTYVLKDLSRKPAGDASLRKHLFMKWRSLFFLGILIFYTFSSSKLYCNTMLLALAKFHNFLWVFYFHINEILIIPTIVVFLGVDHYKLYEEV